MPRRKNTKPTSIYWLTDIRPETMAEGWPQGKPFYCGKTVGDPRKRFMDHICRARRHPQRKISKIIAICGRKNIRIVVMAVVLPDGDWAAAERQWIAQIRLTNPDSANVGHGGEGPAGMIHSEETRAKMREIQRDRPAEWNKRISLGKIGVLNTPEARANMSIGQRASKLAAENLRRMTETNRGRVKSPEERAKLSASLRASFATNPRPKGRKNTPETIAKRSASVRAYYAVNPRKGHKSTPEANAKRSASIKAYNAANPRPKKPKQIREPGNSAAAIAQQNRRARERAAAHSALTSDATQVHRA